MKKNTPVRVGPPVINAELDSNGMLKLCKLKASFLRETMVKRGAWTAALRDFKSVYVRFGSGKRAWLRAL
jgi:hypothetical protein